MTLSVLELLARGGAVGALLAQAGALFRGGPTPARVTGALFCLAAAAHVLEQTGPVRDALGPSLIVIWCFSVVGAGLLWAFVTELFADRRRLDPRRFLPAAALLVIAIAAEAAGSTSGAGRALWLIHKAIGIALMAHVLMVTLTGWRGDLVERRRRMRAPILAAAALYAIATSSVEAAHTLGTQTDALSPLAAAALLLMSLAGAFVFLRAEPDWFGAPKPGRVANLDAAASAQDQALLGRLRKALDEDQVWRREALSIGELAGLVGAPEHRLRRLINAHLGYRNFAAFLNERRISAARLALADPAHALTPVSQIAYEAGFASLGPFNRAFKEATGSTPTAWREQALAGPAPEASPNPQIAG
jgi:AraC-like DNA-binding protein